MPRAGLQLRKFAILCHRWLGTVFCVLFFVWFFSGIVLMYWDYPQVDARERLARASSLDPHSIRVSQAEAYAALGADSIPDRVRIAVLDGRPVYRFSPAQFGNGRSESIVYADDARILEDIPQDLALRIASAWTGQPAADAKFEGALTHPDQWTVSGEFRPLRPLWKFSWPDGESVYVSEVTGEVVQYTTRGSRIGAYFGAIPHWLYFTPLRSNGPLWSRVVIWASGIGVVTSILGLIVGVWISLPSKRIPYTGPKRWHTILGLIFGLVTCTWVFSGMLSMDPFGWEAGAADDPQEAALLGVRWNAAAFADKSPGQALGQALNQALDQALDQASTQASTQAGRTIKELDLTFFAGEPVYLAIESPQSSVAIPVHGEPSALFDSTRVAEVLASASRPYALEEVRVIAEYEPYYIDRHHARPLPVLLVRLNDPGSSMYYVDLKTARIVESYGAKSRWNRWLYHGLHSIDLPWLYKHRPAWDIFVLTLMLGGASLSVTSVILGWQFLRRKVR
jgi:hypothetical protein